MSLGEKSILTISRYNIYLSLSLISIHRVWLNNIRTCVDWPFANICVWWQWLRLWRPVSISKSTKNLSHAVYPNMWRNQTSGSGFFFVSIVIMIADKDLSCCSVASRVSSRQIQNLSCKCPMHLYQAASLLHWFCAKRFRPNHILPFLLSYTRADENATFDLAWSSSRQSTELYKRQEFLASYIRNDL